MYTKNRIIVLPEELEIIEKRLDTMEEMLRKSQNNVADPILDTEGVMALLKVSRRTIQTWRDAGMIEFSAVGGKYYYRMSAINKMLDKHLQKMEDL